MSENEPTLRKSCAAELVGTFLLIFFGCGSVHAAVTLDAFSGVWQVASMWGFGVTLAVYAVGSISGAHINPAITVASACFGGFPGSRVLPYVGSQLAGAFLAAAALHMIFSGSIKTYEEENGIVRGDPGSEVTASMYGEYFPNPTVDLHGSDGGPRLDNLTTPAAVFAELVATAILAFCVFSFTDPRNRGGPGERLAPLFIGVTVTLLIGVRGPLTQACLNPARDFGPRLFASLAGWGSYAWTGQVGVASILAVYACAPIAGAVIGAGAYKLIIGSAQPE